jgi:hypothetical protein
MSASPSSALTKLARLRPIRRTAERPLQGAGGSCSTWRNRCFRKEARRWHTRYTIETRPLTRENTPRSDSDGLGPAVIEATDAGEALSAFARDKSSEVVSFQPVTGRESIATVRWHDDVFLVRVYAD